MRADRDVADRYRFRRPLAMAAAMPLGDGVELDSDDDAEATGRRLEAWERAYANAKSWEALEEDESGRLRGLDPTVNQRAKRCARRSRGMRRHCAAADEPACAGNGCLTRRLRRASGAA